MKTIYDQTDVGRQAKWLHPLFKPLLALLLVFLLGMTVNAAPPTRYSITGTTFCWNGTSSTNIGLDTAFPLKFHVLLQVKPDSTVSETGLYVPGPGTTAAFDFVIDWGKNLDDAGLYVVYVFPDGLSYLNAKTAGWDISAIKGNGGMRQNGELWIFTQPLVQTLSFYGQAGVDYSMHFDTAIYCKGSAGLTINDTELSKYAGFVGSTANDDYIDFDHWAVTYTLINDSSDVFAPINGDGDSIAWTGVQADPNLYYAKAKRGYYYTGSGTTCAEVFMTDTLIVRDVNADVKNINTGLCYLTIQEAIDATETQDGHTLWCLTARDYVENLTVNKALIIMPDPTSTDTGFWQIMGKIDITTNDSVTIKNFDNIWALGYNYAINVTGNAKFNFENIGGITSDFNGIEVHGTGEGSISNCVFLAITNRCVDLDSGAEPVHIFNNVFEGIGAGSIGVISGRQGCVIENNFFNDVETGVQLGFNDGIIRGNQFENVIVGGKCIYLQTLATNTQIYRNGFGHVNTIAIETEGNNPVSTGFSNWYGSPTGPTIASNPCGAGSQIIEGSNAGVTYSPWYFTADPDSTLDFAGVTLNGIPPLGLTDIPDMSTITKTPMVFSMSVTYPDGLSNYDTLVLTDARIISSVDFPAGSQVLSLKYDGTETLATPFNLPVNDTVFLSQILGATKGMPFKGHNNSTHVWDFTIGGFNAQWDASVVIDAVTYIDIDTLMGCKNVLATDTLQITFDTASMSLDAIDTEVCTTVDSLKFSVEIDYPAIVAINDDVKANARITCPDTIPAGTEIYWGFGAPAAPPAQGYTVPANTTEIFLSEIVGGAAPYPLVGHNNRIDTWYFTIVAPVGTYNMTIDAIAQLEGTHHWNTLDSNYVYKSVSQQLIVHPLPTATISIVGPNHICADKDTAAFSVALTGTQPWEITYTDGTDSVTVSNILTSPYTFSKHHDRNKTWKVTNVKDAYCENFPTDTVRVYIGTVTYIGRPVSDTVCEGEAVSIPIKVVNFEDVGSLSLTLQYDTNVLTYVDFTNPNPSMFYFTMNPILGFIKIGGSSPLDSLGNLQPFQLPDSTTLFLLNFIYKSGSNALKWDTINPAACEYVAASNFQPFCDQDEIHYYKDMFPEMTGNLRPKATVSGNDTICNTHTGSFTVDLIGTKPWIFTYSDGTNNYTIDSIQSTPLTVFVSPTTTTTYTPVSVSDTNGCNFWAADLQGSATVVVNDLPIWTDTVAKITCYGADNGFISVTVSGAGPFIYHWTGPMPSLPDTSRISNLEPGTYTLIVEDANGCTDSASYTVLEPTVLSAKVGSTNATCYNTPDGTITVSAPAGGWGNKHVTIDGGTNWETFVNDSVKYTDLAYGQYIVTLRDSIFNDCQVNIDTVVIENPVELGNNYGITMDPITCNGAANGRISFSGGFHGGHGRYEASIDSMATWSPMVLDSVTVSFDSLAPGTYDLFVRDYDYPTCYKFLGTLTLEDPTQLTATIDIDSVTCFGGINGVINVSASGGYGKYEYSLDSLNWRREGRFAEKAAGVYTIYVRDSTYITCQIKLQDTIFEPVVMSAATDTTNITCNSADDGVIDIINAAGGHGTYEYSIDYGITWQSSTNFPNLAPGTYFVVMRDVADTLCIVDVDTVTFVEPDPIPLMGSVKYYKNGTGTPFALANVEITIKDGATVVAQDTTDASGNYLIDHLCPGSYTIEARSLSGPILDPVNFTDAAKVASWTVKQDLGPIVNSIAMVRFLAGDVKKETFGPFTYWNLLNTTDANYIEVYFLNNYINAWDGRAKWSFWTYGATDTISRNRPATYSTLIQFPSVSIAPLPNSGDTCNLYGLYTGDFDYSWPGPAKSSLSSSVKLEAAQTRFVEPGTEFELPILAGKSMDISAVSLILNFPSEKLEIVGAYLGNDPDATVQYNLIGNELRLGWRSIYPMSLNSGDKMFTLRLRLTSALAQGETLQLTLTNDYRSEIADASIEVISDALLVADKIASKPISVEEITGQQMAFANYPNPFNHSTTFVFDLPYEGVASIEVFDLVGRKVNVTVNEYMVAGEHRVTLGSSDLKPGVYTATLTLKTDGKSLKRTIKIIRNQ